MEGGHSSDSKLLPQAALSTVACDIPDLERQIVAQKCAGLGFLGLNPVRSLASGPRLHTTRLTVPAGLAATLLEAAPHLREAEHNLIASNAKRGVAKANFFPTYFLSGNFRSAQVLIIGTDALPAKR